jgi:hypothetical protein
MYETQSENSSIDIPSLCVTPKQPRDNGRHHKCHDRNQQKVISVLPFNDFILGQIANISDAGLAPWLNHHPSYMRPQEAFVGIVRIEIGVGVAMVSTVSTRPPLDRPFDGTCTCDSEKILERLRGVIGPVGPEAMVARCDACTSAR